MHSFNCIDSSPYRQDNTRKLYERQRIELWHAECSKLECTLAMFRVFAATLYIRTRTRAPFIILLD